MSAGFNLEVWFLQQDEVSVFLESSVVDPDEEQFYETCLFALYASRQLANLRGDGASLAFTLQATDTANSLRQAKQRLGEVRVSSPTSASGGRKGFTCKFRPDKRRAFFKLNLHGFGLGGRGANYYAPTSTLVLLYWLLNRRKDDATYQRALAAAAENVGTLGTRGAITVTSQAPLAMEAAAAAWREAMEQASLPDGFELSDEARLACAEHDIDFMALVSVASGRLQESLEEMEGEGNVVLPDALARRISRVEVLIAAELEDEGLDRAYAAVNAAEATEDEAVIEAANAHYDKALADVVDENDLEPVVEALESVLFTDNPEGAASVNQGLAPPRIPGLPDAATADAFVRIQPRWEELWRERGKRAVEGMLLEAIEQRIKRLDWGSGDLIEQALAGGGELGVEEGAVGRLLTRIAFGGYLWREAERDIGVVFDPQPVQHVDLALRFSREQPSSRDKRGDALAVTAACWAMEGLAAPLAIEGGLQEPLLLAAIDVASTVQRESGWNVDVPRRSRDDAFLYGYALSEAKSQVDD